MLLFRLSVLLVSISWLFILPIYIESNYRTGIIFLLLSWFIASWAGTHTKIVSDQQSRWKLLLECLIVGLIITLTTWIIQAGLWPFYARFASVHHSAWLLAPVVCGLLRLFGWVVSWQGEVVAVQDFREVIRFSITLEKLAFFSLLFFLIGESVNLLLLNVSHPWKRIARTIACLFAYSILRLVVLCAIYLYAHDIALFWHPMYIFFSLLPLPLLLERFNAVTILYREAQSLGQKTSMGRSPDSLGTFLKEVTHRIGKICPCASRWSPSQASIKQVITGASLVFLMVTGFTGYLVFEDPGVAKQGRVLIDEAHSNWEWVTRPFDKHWFGQKSLYNYYLARDFADHYFHVNVNTEQHITESLLDRYDVLVVKTPTVPFSADEKRAIYRFVHNGGGLFLIGDHTNLFGMSTILNDLARPFRIEFNFDDTFALRTGGTTSYTRPRYIYHPIVRNIANFIFETSCTLSVPLSAGFVMIGLGLGREWIDYSHKNFFGNMKLDPDEDFGLFVQAAAVKHGRGRVVAFSDSTVFSNFSFFWPGKSEFFIQALDYLNRENKYGDNVNQVFLFIGIGGLIGLLLFLQQSESRLLIPFFVLIGTFGCSISVTFIDGWNSQHYGKLRPRKDYTRVAFETQYSRIGLTEVSALLAEQLPEEHVLLGHEHGYGHLALYRETFRTFYVNIARLGVYPTVKSTLREALRAANIVIIINPGKYFSKEDVRRIDRFLRYGGRLLLMDSITNDNTISNRLLRRFNTLIRFAPVAIKTSLYVSKSHNIGRESQSNVALDNSAQNSKYNRQTYGLMLFPRLQINSEHRPIFGDEDKRLLAVEIQHGQGSLIVFVDSAYFSNAVMGRVYKKPTEQELKVYRDMFYLFEHFVLKRQEDTLVKTVSGINGEDQQN